jgi:hypothetical protein
LLTLNAFYKYLILLMMKTKLLLSSLFTFVFCLLSSQVPQGFNYQAIARDGSGNLVVGATIKVKLSILSDTTGFYISGGGTYLWEEEQTNVKTNAFGLFTVVLGNQSATKIQGSASSFGTIDWAKTPLYIGTKIANPTDYKNLGSAKLWSVPYSMVADSTKALLKGSRLSVISSNDVSTDALFEVKRKDGQTVFAVYPNAVNIYVPRTTPKGVKGGFAIGGFDGSKIDPQDYFRVTPDSIRIYIDKTPDLVKGATKGGFAIGGFDQVKGWKHDLLTVSKDSVRIYIDKTPSIKGATKGGFAIGGFAEGKGETQDLLTVSNDSIRMYINDLPGKGATKGGFAIGGFDQVKGNNNFLNVATEATGIINPSQNRILWYPIKNAFLTGKVLIEKPDSVGVNSFATGYESKAKGQYSQALGYKATARGDNSTSIGNQSVASKSNSFALGQFAQARNDETYAFGRGAIAEGLRSYAFGSAGVDSAGNVTGVAYAKGAYSFTIGQGSQALATGSFAIGIGDTARGFGSMAIGYLTASTGNASLSLGSMTTASGNSSTAMGNKTIASEWASMATGDRTVASGGSSFAGGNFSRATGPADFSFGFNNLASGGQSVAFGFNTRATNWFSTATGNQTHADGNASFAGGQDCEATGDASFSFGWNGLSSGGGSVTFGHNAKATNFASFAIGSETYSSGACSLAGGKFSQARGHNSVSLGDNTKAIGNQSFAMGSNTESHGNSSVSFGQFTKSKSFGSLVIGQYNDTSGVQTDYWIGTDPAFVIGNGNSNSDRKNAFTVLQNGNTGIAMVNPQQKLDIAGGNGRVESGYGWLTNSDLRFKKNISTLESSLEKVLNLRGVRYDLLEDQTSPNSQGKNIGFIAQELEKVVPEVVVTGSDGYKSVAYDKLSAVLTEAIKEQQKQIEDQKVQIESVKQVNLQLKSELDDLKAIVSNLVANQKGQGNK